MKKLENIVEVKDFKSGIIYKYTSPSGKCYIGQTIHERSRKSEHKRKTTKLDTAFARCIRKYGFDNLNYEVLFRTELTPDLVRLKFILDSMEEIYINYANSTHRNHGYNICKGGGGVLGLTHSEETLNKMSEFQSNRTEEHKQKLLEASKGREFSKTTKEKMSKSCKTKKKVYQYKDDELINTFNSIADAARSIKNSSTLKTRSNRISEALSGKTISAYSYEWKRNLI